MKYAFIFLLTSCAPFQIVMKADFYVSKISKSTICDKQKCLIIATKDGVSLLSEGYDITVNEQMNIPERYTVGEDQNGTYWKISIGNLKDEPFILYMRSDSCKIIVGPECYN